jgi:hypothetical protein
VTPAGAVADLPTTATLEEAVNTINELLASLRAGGFIES